MFSFPGCEVLLTWQWIMCDWWECTELHWREAITPKMAKAYIMWIPWIWQLLQKWLQMHNHTSKMAFSAFAFPLIFINDIIILKYTKFSLPFWHKSYMVHYLYIQSFMTRLSCSRGQRSNWNFCFCSMSHLDLKSLQKHVCFDTTIHALKYSPIWKYTAT